MPVETPSIIRASAPTSKTRAKGAVDFVRQMRRRGRIGYNSIPEKLAMRSKWDSLIRRSGA